MKTQIPNIIHPHVLINISMVSEDNADYWYLMPSVQVKSLDNIPEGFDSFTFPSSLCARCSFLIHQHNTKNYMLASNNMFRAINEFMEDDSQKYFLEQKKINIDRFDLSSTDEFNGYWEWFAPVRLKTNSDIPEQAPEAIATYRKELPTPCFVRKKITEPEFSYKAVFANQDECCFHKMFVVFVKSLTRLKNKLVA